MEIGSVSERIAQMVEHFHKGNKSAFAKAVGISNQSLGEIVGARQSAPSFAALQKMLTAFPEVRMEWLVMGKGEMLASKQGELVEPFANAFPEDGSKRQFLPPTFDREAYKKEREEEWARYNAAVEQQKQTRTVIMAVFEHLAEKDPSVRQILDSLPSAFEDILDPDTVEQLTDAEHERLSDDYHADK
ncbi:hypothetical protein GCM10027422_28660 [Hymenobacter arcticus]